MGDGQASIKSFLGPAIPRKPGRVGLCGALGKPAEAAAAAPAAAAPFAAFALNAPPAGAAKRPRALEEDDDDGDDDAAAAPRPPARRVLADTQEEEEEEGEEEGAQAATPAHAHARPVGRALLDSSPEEEADGRACRAGRPAPGAPGDHGGSGGGGGRAEDEEPIWVSDGDTSGDSDDGDASDGDAGASRYARVLEEVERIGLGLRAALAAGGEGGGGGFGITAEAIATACAARRHAETDSDSEQEEEEGEEGEEGEEEEEEGDDATPPPQPAPAPAPLLKPYQALGVNWLALLRSRGLSAILADEMGLGKTAQAASFLAVRAAAGEEAPGRPFLVVVPASLLDNWARELATFAPSLRIARYFGPHRAAVRVEAKARARAGRCPGFDVALASYTAFSSDSATARADRKWLRDVPWSIVVLDEAHAIKNAGAARSAKLAAVAAGAEMRVCLTGTPLQNRPSELRALLAFLMPALFEGVEEADVQAAVGGAEAEAEAGTLRRLLAPFILRRLKADVAAQLVPKTVETVAVAMLPAQAAAYERTVARLRAEVAQARGTTAAAAAATTTARTVNSFTLLRKLALHPLLANTGRFAAADLDGLAAAAAATGTFGTDEAPRVRDHLATLSDFDLHSLAASLGGRWAARFALPPGSVAGGAGKAAALAAMLPGLRAAGHRVLLFSQWTRVLDLLEVLLDDLGLPWSRFDGSTPVGERLALVDAFNHGGAGAPFCMLLSTGAGGQGINLTGADTVICHDAAFNPSVDRQAEDRAHRLGQARPVRVIRMVTAGSVDEGVAEIARRKAALAAAVLGEGRDGDGDGGPSEAEEMGALLAQVLGRQGSGGGGGG